MNYDAKSYYGGVALKPTNAPEITIQQPASSSLKDGKSKRSFGSVSVGQTSAVMTFTIRNSGKAPLNNLAIKKSGANKKDFIVTGLGKTTLAPGKKTTFSVTFKPKPNAKAARSAFIAVSSNDADENPFSIELTGKGVE